MASVREDYAAQDAAVSWNAYVMEQLRTQAMQRFEFTTQDYPRAAHLAKL